MYIVLGDMGLLSTVPEHKAWEEIYIPKSVEKIRRRWYPLAQDVQYSNESVCVCAEEEQLAQGVCCLWRHTILHVASLPEERVMGHSCIRICAPEDGHGRFPTSSTPRVR
jgi:hypothetical protein